MRRFLSDAGWILGLRLANLPLQFALFALAAHYHALETVGIYAVFYAGWSLARQLGPCGLDLGSARFIPAFMAAGRPAAARDLERSSRALVALAMVVLACLALVAGQTGRWLGLWQVSDVALLAGLAAAPGFALVTLYGAQLRARGRPRAAQAPDALLLPLASIAAIQLLHLTVGSGLTGLLASHALGVWLTVGLYAWLARRQEVAADGGMTGADWRQVRTASLSLTAAGATNALALQLPVLLVSASLGAAAAGLYEGARRFAQLGTLATWAAGAAVSPLLSDAHARGHRERLQALLAVSSWAAFLPTLGLLAVLVAAGPALLSLFGPGFVAAYPAMVVLAVFTAVNASGGLSSAALNMTGHENTVLRFNLLQLLAVLLGVPLLAGQWGLQGAALAVLIGGVVRDGGLSLVLPARLSLVPGVWSWRGTRIAWRALAGWRGDGGAAAAG